MPMPLVRKDGDFIGSDCASGGEHENDSRGDWIGKGEVTLAAVGNTKGGDDEDEIISLVGPPQPNAVVAGPVAARYFAHKGECLNLGRQSCSNKFSISR